MLSFSLSFSLIVLESHAMPGRLQRKRTTRRPTGRLVSTLLPFSLTAVVVYANHAATFEISRLQTQTVPKRPARLSDAFGDG